LKVEYYAAFIQRGRDYEGVGPISEEEARRRNVSYRFLRRGGKVEQFDVINGRLLLTPYHTASTSLNRAAPDAAKRESSYHLHRDGDGKLLEEVAYDRAGEVVYTFHYTSPSTGHYTDRHGFPVVRSASGAAYIRSVWTEEGFKKEEWFLDRQ